MISSRIIRAFDKFDADLKAFSEETGEEYAILYEDAYTTREVKDFQLRPDGRLSWWENERREATLNVEQVLDDDDAREWLSFWRATLRRARRYWAMDVETLDKIQDGEIADEEGEE